MVERLEPVVKDFPKCLTDKNMKNLFVWFYKSAGRPLGVPFQLNTTLTERFNPKNPLPGFDYPWVGYNHYQMDFPPKQPELQLPAHLFFVVKKEKELLFDFLNFKGEYKIVSKEFLALIEREKMGQHYEIAALTVVSDKGKSITKKEYFALRFGKFDDALVSFEETSKASVPNLADSFVYSEISAKKETNRNIFFVDNFCYQETVLLTQEGKKEIESKLYCPAIFSAEEFVRAFQEDNEW